MPPWLQHVRSYQNKESKINSSRWIQLATVSPNNTPRVRTVVFRGWSDIYEMKIMTDKRSQKYNELETNNNVEICWLFPKSRCQFRFRGKSMKVMDKETLYHWEQLNDKDKLMWNWPTPGEILNNDKYNNLTAKTNSDQFKNFVLLKIDIYHVDQLILDDPRHRRRQWIRNTEWTEEQINP